MSENDLINLTAETEKQSRFKKKGEKMLVRTLRIKKSNVDKYTWKLLDAVYDLIKPIFLANSYNLYSNNSDRELRTTIFSIESSLLLTVLVNYGIMRDFQTNYWYVQLVHTPLSPSGKEDADEKGKDAVATLLDKLEKALEKIGLEKTDL